MKNGKFNNAKKYLQKKPNLKLALKFQILDEKRTQIKQEKLSKEVSLKESFIIFSDEKIIL